MDESQRQFLEAQRVLRLATVDPGGQPYLVPICFALDGDTLYSAIDEKPKQASPGGLRRLRNVAANPRVALLADRGNGPDAWPRGAGAGKFPADRESLFAYDLVVFGEVPRQFFRLEELEWLRDFVDKRGGGLMVIDGRRGHVAGYADTPLGALFPVDWKADPVGRPSALRPTDTGSRKAMLQLAGDAEKNFETWASLLPPHWVANARVLPGAEVLLEAVAGERRVPALVQRRFGIDENAGAADRVVVGLAHVRAIGADQIEMRARLEPGAR